VPYVALSAHKMLSGIAALKMAIDLLQDTSGDASERAEIAARAHSQLVEMERTLKELIVAPRDLHTDPTHDRDPA
jgi:hypothetical protein